MNMKFQISTLKILHLNLKKSFDLNLKFSIPNYYFEFSKLKLQV
jgi:hypothetical protein